jgi:MSHA biogenesis protein MshM
VYLEHFGLRELPFTLSPNTEFFIELEGHRQAIELIRQALQEGKGCVQISGEVGTGKTLLCRRLLQILDAHYRLAYIPNPFLSPEGLLLALIRELGIEINTEPDMSRLLSLLQGRLQELKAAGKKVLLVLDDVQAMPESTLNTLLNLAEKKDRHFLQLIFVGQPELDDLLRKDKLQGLRNMISHRFALPSLSRDETGLYINHRLTKAGFPGFNLFTPQAVEQIHKAGRGNPRIINILCHKALLTAFSKCDTSVSIQHTARAIEETEEARPNQKRFSAEQLVCNWRTMLLACMGASAMTFTLVWALILR